MKPNQQPDNKNEFTYYVQKKKKTQRNYIKVIFHLFKHLMYVGRTPNSMTS